MRRRRNENQLEVRIRGRWEEGRMRKRREVGGGWEARFLQTPHASLPSGAQRRGLLNGHHVNAEG